MLIGLEVTSGQSAVRSVATHGTTDGSSHVRLLRVAQILLPHALSSNPRTLSYINSVANAVDQALHLRPRFNVPFVVVELDAIDNDKRYSCQREKQPYFAPAQQ